MSEQLDSRKKPGGKISVMSLMLIVGAISLLVGWGVSKLGTNFLGSDKASMTSSSASRALTPLFSEFLKAEWKDPEGRVLDTSSWGGKTVVINFWGSWCPPCVEEMPMLVRLNQEFKEKNILFVGIGIDSPDNVRNFLKKTPVNYPIAMGGLDGSQWAKRFGDTTGGLPFTVVIQANGESKFTKLGKLNEVELRSILK